MLRISLASDHAGFTLKEEIKTYLQENGFVCHDFGTYNQDAVDYPDLAYLAARAVQKGEFDRGIIVCGTGIGVSIAANKLRGIRAAHCTESYSARCSREHNDANILTLGSRVTGSGLALEIVRVFLETPFAGGRHVQRVAKIHKLEELEMQPDPGT